MEMRWQLLLWFLPAVLILPLSEGTRGRHIQPLGNRFIFVNTGSRNHRPPAKPEAPLAPNSALEDQNSFCEGGCRDGWMSYLDHCYLYVKEPRSWLEAESACQNLVPGGHLTSISSAEHNDFLMNLATYLAQKPTMFWTGGSHRKGGSLQWTDGAKTNFLQRPLGSLLDFAGAKITQILRLNIQICLQIGLRGQGRWDGMSCRKRLPFICSYKPDLTPP